jgi:hypothetical protein
MTASEPSSPDATPLSNENQEPGLWLWQGEALPHTEVPPSASLSRPPSRVERIAYLVGSAVRRARWLAPPSGWALVALAAWGTVHLLPGGQSISGNTSAAALQPMPAPSLARPISPAPPPPLAETPLDRVQAPSAPVTQAMAGPPQHKTVKWRARHRSPLTVRRSHAFAYRRTPVFVEQCRYGCDWADATAWHGGGY